MDKFLSIKERILQLSKTKGFRLEDFCEKIDMTYGNFKGKNKSGTINSDAIVKILTIIPDVNLFWLLTGEGEMLKNELKNENTIQTSNSGNFEFISYLKDQISIKDKKIEELSGEVSSLKKDVEFLKKKIGPVKYNIAAEP